MLPVPPAISQPSPETPQLASPAYVQKYNQVRKLLGMDSDIKEVFQRTENEGFVSQIKLFDRPKKGGRLDVTFASSAGALIGVWFSLDTDTLVKKHKENPGPLVSQKDVEPRLESLIALSLPAHDRKNWEIVHYRNSQNDGNVSDYFPQSSFYLRRLVDNIPVIPSSIFLTADAQLGQVFAYKYEEKAIIPQAMPFIPQETAKAIAQKAFLDAGGSPKTRCRLVWDRVAWWPLNSAFNRLAYHYEFELRDETTPENQEGAVWSVPIDAQTGDVWGIRMETSTSGPKNIPKVTTRGNPYFRHFAFASDSLEAQKLGIAALSIPKAEPTPAPETFSCLVTPKRKVYYHWDPKQSKLAFAIDNTKDWFGGVISEKAVKPLTDWLKTQPAPSAEKTTP